MKKYSFFLTICTFLFFGCNDKKTTDCEFNYSLIRDADKKVLLLSHDSLSVPNNCTMRYYFDNISNQSFIYSLNHLNNSIDIYLLDGKMKSRINLTKEGPNGVGVINNFYVKSLDSIYVISPSQISISLLNSEGKLHRKYSYLSSVNGKETLGEGLQITGGYANQIIESNNTLIVGAVPFDDPNLKRFYEKNQSGITINLRNGDVVPLTTLPKQWKNRFQEGYVLTGSQMKVAQTYDIQRNKCVISYMTEKELSVIDVKTKNSYLTDASSCFFSTVKWYERSKAEKHNIDDEFNYYSKEPQFSSIYFDEYRKVFYRFVGHPNILKKDELDDRAWFIYSVIILDRNLKKIGETMLQEGYQPNNVLLAKDGVYLQYYQKNEQYSFFHRYNLKISK